MAVTREGIPVRVWTFAGNTSDQMLIRKVSPGTPRRAPKEGQLNRVIWVLDRGFTSAQNRRYLQRASGRYIVGEKLRSTSLEAKAALGRQGRYHTVTGSLRVKPGTPRSPRRIRPVYHHKPGRIDAHVQLC